MYHTLLQLVFLYFVVIVKSNSTTHENVPVLQEKRVVEYNSTGNNEYKYFPAQDGCFTFKVRVKHQASLVLTTKPSYSEPKVLIYLNIVSDQSVMKFNGSTVEIETPGMLSENSFKGFWLRWDKKTIKIGRSKEKSPFMSTEVTELFPIKFVGVATSGTTTGTWLLDQEHCSSVPAVASFTRQNAKTSKWKDATEQKDQNCTVKEINTMPRQDYMFYPAPDGCFTFKVRAEKNVYLALARNTSYPRFQIYLDLNSESYIQKRRTDVAVMKHPPILNAEEFRGFWVSWTNNEIVVGRHGEVSGFISWEDSDSSSIQYFGIQTFNTNGTWLIDEGFCTPPVKNFKTPKEEDNEVQVNSNKDLIS